MAATSSSSAKRKQEERLTQTLRELAALPSNKQCFDCNQRGPTYVNMTIGSFVCTSCSGILRGINPPHRVKSISMATFSPEEVDFVKARGNDYCRKVWLGLFEGETLVGPHGFKDENQMKDLLVQKYEKKRWYVSPSEIARQQQYFDKMKQQQQSTASVASNSSASSSVLTSPESTNAEPLSNGLKNMAISRPLAAAAPTMHNSASLIDTSPAVAKAKPFGSQSIDLFSAAASAPPHQPSSALTSSLRQPASQPQQQLGATLSSASNSSSVVSNDFGGFADFDAAFSSGALAPSGNQNISNAFNVPKSQTVPSSLGTSPPILPMPVNVAGVTAVKNGPNQTPAATVIVAPSSGGDKYSALADLDDVFRTGNNATPTKGLVGGSEQQSHAPNTSNPFGTPLQHSQSIAASGATSTMFGTPASLAPAVTVPHSTAAPGGFPASFGPPSASQGWPSAAMQHQVPPPFGGVGFQSPQPMPSSAAPISHYQQQHLQAHSAAGGLGANFAAGHMAHQPQPGMVPGPNPFGTPQFPVGHPPQLFGNGAFGMPGGLGASQWPVASMPAAAGFGGMSHGASMHGGFPMASFGGGVPLMATGSNAMMTSSTTTPNMFPAGGTVAAGSMANDPTKKWNPFL